MEPKLLRIECLKLASLVSRSPGEILAQAKIYEEYAIGPQGLTEKSENIAKSPVMQDNSKNGSKKKGDNSKDIMS